MTDPINPTPSAMPSRLPAAEHQSDETAEQPPRTMEWFEHELSRVRKESANYRTRLRAAESDIEQAAAQLGAMRHAEIERFAAEHLRDPSDVWRAQADTAAFLDEEFGTVDPAKVAEVAQALTAEKPHYAADKRVPPPPSDRPVEGLRAGATPADYTGPTQPTWADVIPKPAGRISPAE